MNLHQLNQWERVPEKNLDKTRKIASSKGSFLRLPVYKVKHVQKKTANGKLVEERQRLTSTVNFANRESTTATWQIDDVYDPLTNSNGVKTEVTQTND